MNTVLLCITAGRGPVECRQAAVHIISVMKREADELGLVIAIEDMADHKASVLLTVGGCDAAIFARSWEGTIQWIARSDTRPGHKRKNWFVAVRRLSEPLECPAIAASDLRFETLRAGGPGGQHQNRTESAVRVIHVPTGLSVVARDDRSQHRNKALVIERLRSLLGAIHERDQNAARFRDWLAKIAVERGNPVRTYTGPDFIRRL